MHRFFSENISKTTKTASITDKKEIHHIKNVLRLKKGVKVSVFDKIGLDANGKITSISREKIIISIDNILESSTNKTRIILACAVPKKSKFETIIEKCTELGVDEIIPLKTERTLAAAKGDRAIKKLSRYKTVALNAVKQSQRSSVPVIHPITKFSEALTASKVANIAFIPCLFGDRKNLVGTLQSLKEKPKKIFIFIGPEGDFTKNEVSSAIKLGCIPVTLGETTLKVDTAAITVCALSNSILNVKE